MSRTRRTVHPDVRKPQPLERTYRGLGDPEPYWLENLRNHNAHGFDGCNRDARHPNTLRREKRVTGKRRRLQVHDEA